LVVVAPWQISRLLNNDIDVMAAEFAHLTQHFPPVPASEAVDKYCKEEFEIIIEDVAALFVMFIRGDTVERDDICDNTHPYIVIRPVPDVCIKLTGDEIKGLFLISVLINTIYTLELFIATTSLM